MANANKINELPWITPANLQRAIQKEPNSDEIVKIALLEQALMEANREREKTILKGTAYSVPSPSHSDTGTDDNISEVTYYLFIRLKCWFQTHLIGGINMLIPRDSGIPRDVETCSWQLEVSKLNAVEFSNILFLKTGSLSSSHPSKHSNYWFFLMKTKSSA